MGHMPILQLTFDAHLRPSSLATESWLQYKTVNDLNKRQRLGHILIMWIAVACFTGHLVYMFMICCHAHMPIFDN